MPAPTAPKIKPIMTREAATALAVRLITDVQQAMSDNETVIDTIRASRRMMEYDQPLLLDRVEDNEDGDDEGDIEARNKWRSRMVNPYTKNAKKALLAHLLPLLIDPDPVFGFTPNNHKSKVFTHALENYQQGQLTRTTPYHEFAAKAIDAALTDMVAVVKVTWQQRWEMRHGWADGAEGEEPRYTEKLVMAYDAPDFTLIPFEQIGTFPRANWDIQRSPGFFAISSFTGEEIIQQSLMDETDGGFWPDAVKAMRVNPPDASDARDSMSTDAGTHDVSSEARGVETGTTETEFLSGKYDITEIYWRGEIDTEDEDGKPLKVGQDVVLAVHMPSQTVLGCTRNPWGHGQRPYILLQPWPDRDGNTGDNIDTTGAGHVQRSLTEIGRLAEDVLKKALNPPLLTGKSLGEDKKTVLENNVPGGMIGMNEAYWQAGGNRLQPFTTAQVNPNTFEQLYELYISIGQKCTGDTEAMEQSPVVEMTATAAQQIMETSQASLLLVARNLSYGLRRWGEMLFWLNYQFMGNPGPQALWADINGEVMMPTAQMPAQMPAQMQQLPADAPFGGQGMAPGKFSPGLPVAPLPPQPMSMYDAFTQGSYYITCNGVRDTANRRIRAQRAAEILQYAMQDPTIWTNPSLRYEVVYNLFLANGIGDPAQYIGEHDEYVAMDAQMKSQAEAEKQKVFQQAVQIETIKHQSNEKAPKSREELFADAFYPAYGAESGKVIGANTGAHVLPAPIDMMALTKDIHSISVAQEQHQQQQAQPAQGPQGPQGGENG